MAKSLGSLAEGSGFDRQYSKKITMVVYVGLASKKVIWKWKATNIRDVASSHKEGKLSFCYGI